MSEDAGKFILSERTRRAIQDYTALNTIFAAFEALDAARAEEEEPSALALALIDALARCGQEERLRVKLNCPLGRRGLALGLLTPRRG